jgi:hypothetical protein
MVVTGLRISLMRTPQADKSGALAKGLSIFGVSRQELTKT